MPQAWRNLALQRRHRSFPDLNILPNLVELAGHRDASASLVKDFFDFHHLMNPLSVEGWKKSFESAGFEPEVHVPILPQWNSGVFLMMDGLWHVKRAAGGELGDIVYPFLAANGNFPKGFRSVLAGVMEMETDWHDCSGAVFSVRKPLQVIE